MAEGKADLKTLAKSFRRYLKVHQHLDYCLKFNRKTLENRDIKDAYKRLRLAVQTKPSDGNVHKQVNTACRHWTEDTVAVITRHFQAVLADFHFTADSTNWQKAWAMAVNWVKKELVDFDMDVALRAEVKLTEKFNQVAEDKPLFTRHEHFNDKFKNWKLSVQRPILVLGDSNTSRLPKCNHKNVQVDSYPGARFCHALHILENTKRTDHVLKVILSFGINDKNAMVGGQVKRELGAIFKVAKERFPNAEVVMPLISFSKHLPNKCQRTLSHINTLIESLPHLPKLPKAMFQTVRDQIHWSPRTAEHMLSHWRDMLQF